LNVWRKKCFRTLRSQYQEVAADNAPDLLLQSLDVFRERLDYAVEDTVPVRVRFSQKLANAIKTFGGFLTAQEERAVCEHIMKLVTFSETEDARMMAIATQQPAAKSSGAKVRIPLPGCVRVCVCVCVCYCSCWRDLLVAM